MSNITINPPHSGRPNILLEDDQDVELMLAEMQVSDNIRGAGLQTHASDALMNIDDQIDQSEAAASRLSDFFNRIDRIVSELSNVRTSLIALVQSSFFDTIRLRIQTRSIDLGDANPNPIVGQTTSRSMMISLSPDPTITDGRLPHVAVPTLSSTSEDRRVPYTKYAELVPGSLEIAFKHSISALDKDCDNIKHLDDALRFSDLLTLANGSRPAPIPTHANISGYSPQVIKCNSFEGKFYYSVTDEDDCYRYHNERNSCISLIKAMLNEDMLHYLQLSISANDATGTYLKLHEFFNSKKLCKNKTCKYVHKLMTDQQKKDCGYDEDRKDSTRIAKINNNNTMKNGMNNNSLGTNGMHNANYDTAVPLTHEHCMAIGNPRAKTTDENPNGSFFEGQKHHHIKSTHIALNNFKFGGDIEKDISNLRELINILEKAQGSLLTESTKFVVLGKSMTFEKGTPITYALEIILKLWNNISSNKNSAVMAAVSLKSEERICFRFNQGLCKNKTCKYVHKLMTDQEKRDCGYDEDRKDSTRIAKINNNNKMKNGMNNNSLGTNGMHNANYDTAVPLTHEHCMAIGNPRAKTTDENPNGSFFEGQKHHHIKSAHIALNNFKFGGDIEKDISNLRELITILEKAQGSLLTESTKFVVLGKSMTFEKGSPITYAFHDACQANLSFDKTLEIILKLWNNISSNKNSAEMAAVSLKSEERICFRFNQGLCKNKTCKYVHKLMTDQQKKDCGYDEDRKDSTRIAKINNNNKMKNGMNNNSLGKNGMHNANYDTAVPLTHEHCMAIGIPRGKITEKNPIGLSKIQLSQMKSIFIFENKKSIQGRNNNNNNGQSEPWGHNCKKSSATIESLAPKSFFQAILNPLWRTSILKELDNLCGNSCFRWIPDIGQHRLLMMWLFYCKSNYDRKARIVMDGSKCIPCDAVEAVEFASITNRYAQFHHGTYETKYSVRTEPAIQVLQKSRATSQGGRVMLDRVVRVQ